MGKIKSAPVPLLIAVIIIAGIYLLSLRGFVSAAFLAAAPTPQAGAMTVYAVTNPNPFDIQVRHVITDSVSFRYEFTSTIPISSTVQYHLRDIFDVPSPFIGAMTIQSDYPFTAEVVDYDYPTPTPTRTPTPTPTPTCPEDLNGDGAIDISDLQAVAGSFGLSEGDPGYDPKKDLNEDRSIDISDLQAVAGKFGTSCQTVLSASGNLFRFPWDQPSTVELSLKPTIKEVTVAENFDVMVEIKGVRGLAAFQVALNYDPKVIQAVGAEVGPYLGSTNRTVFSLPSIKNTGLITLVASTLGPTPAGPEGNTPPDKPLAVFHFRTLKAETTSISVGKAKVTDTNGLAQPLKTNGVEIKTLRRIFLPAIQTR